MVEKMIGERQEVSTTAMEDNAEGLAGKGFGGGIGSSPRVAGTLTVREHMGTAYVVRTVQPIPSGVLY